MWLLQERAAADLREGGLHTYKQQLSFGVHVILMMAAFFAVGHVAGGAVRPHPAYVRSQALGPAAWAPAAVHCSSCRPVHEC